MKSLLKLFIKFDKVSEEMPLLGALIAVSGLFILVELFGIYWNVLNTLFNN